MSHTRETVVDLAPAELATWRGMRCAENGRGYWAVLATRGGQRFDEARGTHLAGVRRLFLRHFDGADLTKLADYWERIAPGATSPDTPAGDDGECA